MHCLPRSQAAPGAPHKLAPSPSAAAKRRAAAAPAGPQPLLQEEGGQAEDEAEEEEAEEAEAEEDEAPPPARKPSKPAGVRMRAAAAVTKAPHQAQRRARAPQAKRRSGSHKAGLMFPVGEWGTLLSRQARLCVLHFGVALWPAGTAPSDCLTLSCPPGNLLPSCCPPGHLLLPPVRLAAAALVSCLGYIPSPGQTINPTPLHVLLQDASAPS